MKIKFLATYNAPDKYEIKGDTIIAFYQGDSEQFDLSGLEYGDRFIYTDDGVTKNACSPGIISLRGQNVIANAVRDEDGTLNVTLCQAAKTGHWTESDTIDQSEFISEKTYIKEVQNVKR